MKSIKKPIIFIGTGRSGSTLISEIIFRHKDLAFPSAYNERFPKSKLINATRLLFDNGVWRIHGQKPQLNKVGIINKFAFKPAEAYKMWNYLTGDEIDFSRNFLVGTKAKSEQIKIIRNYFKWMVKIQNKKRLAFKITGPSRIEYLTSIFPDAVFIHVVRNPVPVISSFLKVDFWKTRGYQQLWWQGAYSERELMLAHENQNDPVWLTAFQIKKLREITKSECLSFATHCLEINYEDFILNPSIKTNEILKFAGLSKDKDCFNYLEKNPLHKRNRNDSDYFSDDDLQKIYSLFNKADN